MIEEQELMTREYQNYPSDEEQAMRELYADMEPDIDELEDLFPYGPLNDLTRLPFPENVKRMSGKWVTAAPNSFLGKNLLAYAVSEVPWDATGRNETINSTLVLIKAYRGYRHTSDVHRYRYDADYTKPGYDYINSLLLQETTEHRTPADEMSFICIQLEQMPIWAWVLLRSRIRRLLYRIKVRWHYRARRMV